MKVMRTVNLTAITGTDNFLGEGGELTILQIALLAFSILVLLLIGIKLLGKQYAFDIILVILFGAVVARGIIDSLRFFITVVVAIEMIIVIRCRSWFMEASRKITLRNSILWPVMKDH